MQTKTNICAALLKFAFDDFATQLAKTQLKIYYCTLAAIMRLMCDLNSLNMHIYAFRSNDGSRGKGKGKGA